MIVSERNLLSPAADRREVNKGDIYPLMIADQYREGLFVGYVIIGQEREYGSYDAAHSAALSQLGK